MSENKLPKNWKTVKVGKYVISTKGKKPKKISKEKTNECHLPYVNIKAFEKGIVDEYTDGVGCVICEEGDFLMVWDGSRSGYVGKAIKGALGSTLVRLNFPDLENNYAYYFLQSKYIEINTRAKGVGIPHVDPNLLWNYDLLIPPLETQQTIVSKIEELFSELEKGIEDLKTAQQQLKIYRQSVLKWAFEGKLTNENVKEGELPKGWEIKTLGELGKWKGGGTPSKQNKSFWENGTNLWVSSKDMKCKNINDSIDKITDDAIVKSSTKIISKGAILFVMRSGILRHTLPVAIAGKELTVNQDLQSVEPFEFIDSEYLYWYIIGKNQNIRQECSKDGTTVESIDTTSLKKYNILIAPVEEQHQIVQEIESRLSVADKMEESIAQSLQQAEALRQSILKKAFSGDLV